MSRSSGREEIERPLRLHAVSKKHPRKGVKSGFWPSIDRAMYPIRTGLPLLALLGCGDVSGEGDFPGAVVATAPDGSFRLRYLDPPWGLKPAEAPAMLRLVAEIRGGAIGDVASEAPTHLLDIGPVPETDSEVACVAAEELAIALGAEIEVEQRSVDTLFGDVGHEFLSVDPIGLKHRDIFFTLRDGRVVRLGFASIFDTDDPDLDLILDGFEPL